MMRPVAPALIAPAEREIQWRGEQEGRTSFLKKRSKKLLQVAFNNLLNAEARGLAALAKVFCFFFSKKKSFLASLTSAARAPAPAGG